MSATSSDVVDTPEGSEDPGESTEHAAATSPVQLTDSAAAKIKLLQEGEPSTDLKLRVYITGGGCAGFSYGFTFDEEVKEGDTQIQKEGVTMLIDALSIQYLTGSKVDYKEGLMGSQFVVENPNATTTCGCGSSFSV